MIIDSHCHIDFPEFDDDREQVLASSDKLGINHIIVPGVTCDAWPRIKACCKQYPMLHPCYGLHPYFIEQHHEDDLTQLEHWLITENPVAVGECGLDYYLKHLDKQLQHFYFHRQLELAQQYDLPVVIHARKSTEDVINIIKQYPGISGMIHSYSGSFEQAIKLIDLGFYLSFGGPITYDNAKRLRKLVTSLPLESILVETDAPDQPIAEWTSKRNEPAAIMSIIDTIAALHDIDTDEVAIQTSENAQQLFELV